MGNAAGALAVLAALAWPGLVVPHVVVRDIGQLDWAALREAGVRHIIIDKDNCITLPLDDNVHPDLEPAWERLSRAGFASVLVVSNSAGSSDDPHAIGAEHLARTLQQRVLAHPSKKPATACARQIIDVIKEEEQCREGETEARQGQQPTATVSGPGPARIAVVGDRITTDIILAARMQRSLAHTTTGGWIGALRRLLPGWRRQPSAPPPQVVGILTTRVLEPERLGTRTMRRLEMWTLSRLVSIGVAPGGGWFSRRGGEPAQGRQAVDWTEIAVRREGRPSETRARYEGFAGSELEAQAAASTAAEEARAQLPVMARLRMLPSLAAQRIGGASLQAGMWLGQGWCLIQDGIRLGTKGRIGAPEPSRGRSWRLPTDSADADTTALHLRDGWPGTSRMFAGKAVEPRRPLSRLDGIAALRRRTFATAAGLGGGGGGRPKPPPGWKPNYLAAAAAVILMPTGWYAGTLLHDWLHPSEDDAIVESLRQQQQQGAAAGGAVGPKSASSTPSLAGFMARTQSAQSLYTKRVHVERELNRIDDKLVELRATMAAKRAEEERRAAQQHQV